MVEDKHNAVDLAHFHEAVDLAHFHEVSGIP